MDLMIHFQQIKKEEYLNSQFLKRHLSFNMINIKYHMKLLINMSFLKMYNTQILYKDWIYLQFMDLYLIIILLINDFVQNVVR